MEEKNNYFRMNVLMNNVELEAFEAQKNAGSSRAYFDRLEEFTGTIPSLLEDLRAPARYQDVDIFLMRIDKLQRQLLAAGASALTLEAEKVAELARVRSLNLCAQDLYMLKAKIKILNTTINGARIHSDSAKKTARTLAVQEKMKSLPEMSEKEKASRPKAPLKAEPFEKVCLLLENFELDDAFEMLRSLMEYTYDETVDAALTAVYARLRQFDYAASIAEIKRVLEIIENKEGYGGKKAKKKILAIDDVPDALNIVKSLLEDDYAVYGVTNHKEALKFLMGNSVELILLDIEMPEMNGFTLLSVIHKLGKEYEDIPVFIVSGYIDEKNLKKAREEEVREIIEKPIDVQPFLAKVKELLG